MKFFRYMIVLLLLVITLPVMAWNDTGHRVIASIAYQRLTPVALVEVDKLTQSFFHSGTGYQRFLRAATWADDLRQQRITLFNSWHFINYPWSSDGTKTRAYANINLVTVIQQSMMVVANRRASMDLRALMLLMLVHLVGDAHQPLHCINRFSHAHPYGDDGGNEYRIKTKIAANLHAFWDRGLGLFAPQHMGHQQYNHYIQQLAQQFVQDNPAAQFGNRIDDKQPMDWTRQSYQQAIQIVYNNIVENTYPTSKYIQQGQSLVAQQSVLAGYRLAAVLNQLFDNSSAR